MTVPLLAPLLLTLPAPLSSTEATQVVVLPEGPGARAWASVGETTRPAPLDPELVEALAEGPYGERTWALWQAALAKVVESGDPAAWAALCLVARAQERDLGAWDHYAQLVADPSWAAALRHHLWPGVPLEFPAGPGGTTPPLPEDVVLQPVLLETSGTWAPEFAASAVLFEMRVARIEGLVIEDSRIDLRFEVDSSGIKLESWLREGTPRQLRTRMPEPPGFRIEIEYGDWLRLDGRRDVRAYVPPPGDEPYVLFSRVFERTEPRPGSGVTKRPAGLDLGGLVLEDSGGEPRLPRSEQLAQLIGADVHVVGPDETPRGPFGGIRVRFPREREAREAALRYLVGAIEEHVLARSAPR